MGKHEYRLLLFDVTTLNHNIKLFHIIYETKIQSTPFDWRLEGGVERFVLSVIIFQF